MNIQDMYDWNDGGKPKVMTVTGVRVKNPPNPSCCSDGKTMCPKCARAALNAMAMNHADQDDEDLDTEEEDFDEDLDAIDESEIEEELEEIMNEETVTNQTYVGAGGAAVESVPTFNKHNVLPIPSVEYDSPLFRRESNELVANAGASKQDYGRTVHPDNVYYTNLGMY